MEQYQPKKRESRSSKRFQDLTIKDAFMFAAVMTDPEQCRRLQDGRTTIFLSTKGKNDADVPEQLVHFLKYVEDPDRDPVKADEDEFVAALKRKIGQIKQNQSLGRSYMRLEEEIRRREKEVFQEGMEKGLRKGRDQANRLMVILLKEGRTDDALHAANDPEFQEQMLKEYGL